MTDHRTPNSVFDPKAFRQAMGPGYAVASFKEQSEFTGQHTTGRQSLSCSDAPLFSTTVPQPRTSDQETWFVSLRHRLLLRLDHLLERSHSFTQTRLSEFEDPRPAQTCC